MLRYRLNQPTGLDVLIPPDAYKPVNKGSWVGRVQICPFQIEDTHAVFIKCGAAVAGGGEFGAPTWRAWGLSVMSKTRSAAPDARGRAGAVVDEEHPRLVRLATSELGELSSPTERGGVLPEESRRRRGFSARGSHMVSTQIPSMGAVTMPSGDRTGPAGITLALASPALG